MSTDYQRIRQAIFYLVNNAIDQPDLATLAARVGISPAYLQRLFRRYAGISPKRFLQFLRAKEAKRLLRDSLPVLDTAFEVGCSGAGRLHDLIINTEAMTPGAFANRGAGLTIRFGVCDSPYGPASIGQTDRGICQLRFLDPPVVNTPAPVSAPVNRAGTRYGSGIDQKLLFGCTSSSELRLSLKAEWPQAELIHDDRLIAETGKQIFGHHPNEQLLLLKGTNFQLKVWEALLRIPEPSLISYQNLAQRIGMPTATRAVSNAVGANPVALLIPCHRVIRSSGALGGYRWGLERKAMILSREFARRKDQN